MSNFTGKWSLTPNAWSNVMPKRVWKFTVVLLFRTIDLTKSAPLIKIRSYVHDCRVFVFTLFSIVQTKSAKLIELDENDRQSKWVRLVIIDLPKRLLSSRWNVRTIGVEITDDENWMIRFQMGFVTRSRIDDICRDGVSERRGRRSEVLRISDDEITNHVTQVEELEVGSIRSQMNIDDGEESHARRSNIFHFERSDEPARINRCLRSLSLLSETTYGGRSKRSSASLWR